MLKYGLAPITIYRTEVMNMSYVRAPYPEEIEHSLHKGKGKPPPGLSLRQTSYRRIIEVRTPLKIAVSWISREGKPKRIFWRVKPGMVLIVRKRRARPIDIRSGKTGIVDYIERHKDLYSAARMIFRHIASSLLVKLTPSYDPKIISKHTQIQAWIEALSHALNLYSSKLDPNSPDVKKAVKILYQIASALSTKRHLSYQQAQEIIEKSSGTERIIAIAEAIGILSVYRQNILEQFQGIISLGLKIMAIITRIDQGADLLYRNSIPKLLKQLEPYVLSLEPVPAKTLLRITRETARLYPRIMKVFTFEPYYSCTKSPRIKRLAEAEKYAVKNDPLRLYNLLVKVASEIEKFVLGFNPTPKEIERARIFLARL